MAAKRSIFEEVSEETRSAQVPSTPKPGLIDRASSGARRAIRAWLMVLFAMVVAMIVVGGLTRLTDSGLSITEWAPITGAVPPMSEAAWTAEFEKYQQIPQYELMNEGMTLAEFKGIYWWEWGHRQLGRLVGLVWAVGYLAFLALGKIPTGWTGRLAIPGALGGLQGAIGWWMVSSGLGGEMVSVASYRLAIHLGLAFAILGLLAWYIFKMSRRERDLMQARRAKEPKLWGLSTGLMHLVFLQILLGALVAGIDAGRAFPEWPTMGGGLFPPDPFQLSPIWRNFFEDAGLVQFMHRMVGYLALGFGIFAWIKGRASVHRRTRRAFHWVLAVLVGQVGLGIVAVLTSAQLHVAITHQLIAVVLWVVILRARFLSGYPVASSVREGL